jgi:hypothetical protein
MMQHNKITALYSRLSVGDEDRGGGESSSIVNQKAFLSGTQGRKNCRIFVTISTTMKAVGSLTAPLMRE